MSEATKQPRGDSHTKYTFLLWLVIFNFSFLIFSLLPKEADAAFIINAPNYLGLNSGLVGFWSFDGPDMYGTNAIDRSGNGNNGTLNNGTSVTKGRIGQAVKLDGVDDTVNMGNPADGSLDLGTNSITMSLWVKIKKQSTAYTIVKKYNISPATGFRVFVRDSGNIRTDIGDGTNAVQSTDDGAEIGDDEWHHILVVFNRSTDIMTRYLDGVLYGAEDSISTVTGSVDTTNVFRITSSSGELNGLIDELRIYDRALSPDEIKRLYKIGSTLKINAAVYSDTLNDGLVGFWSFDGPDMYGTNAIDRSGNGNTGTLNDGTSVAKGRIGQALLFDGADDRMGASHIASYTQAPLSASAWFKVEQLPGALAKDMDIIWKKHAVSPSYSWIVFLDEGSAGYLNKIVFRINNAAEAVITVNSDDVIIPNQWYHVAVVLDSSFNMFMYVDGVLQADTENSTSIFTATDQFVLSGGNNTMLGLIDEVRIYDRALSEGEIKRLYKIGATLKINKPTYSDTLNNGLVGFWSFDAADVSTDVNGDFIVLDRSGNANNGSTIGSVVPKKVRGKIGQALEFDGVDDNLEVTSTTAFDFGTDTNFSISFWVRMDKDALDVDRRFFDNFADVDGAFDINFDSSPQSLRVVISDGGGYCAVDGISNIRDGEWHHIAVVYLRNASCTTADILIYVDGVYESNDVLGGSTVNTNVNVDVGGLQISESTNTVAGSLDEVRVYDRALSADEIKRLYNLGK